MTITELLTHFDDVERIGDGYRALCPVHGDKTPSLYIKGTKDRVLVICRSHGCSAEEITAARGLRVSDLFTESRPRSSSPTPRSSSPLAEARREILASARRQRWARPGVTERYQMADTIRATRTMAVQIQTVATTVGDTEIGWGFVALGAELETAVHILEMVA